MEKLGNYGTVIDGKLYGPQDGVVGMLREQGLNDFMAAQRNFSVARKRRVDEAARIYADVLQGNLDPVFLREAIMPRNEVFVAHLMEKYPNLYMDDRAGRRLLGLRETMSITDYQALYVDVLDRMYYGYYNAYPVVNKPIVRVHQLRDFRVVSRYLLDGAVSPYLPIGRNRSTQTSGGGPAGAIPQTALSGPVPQDGSTFPTTDTAPIQYQPLAYGSGTAVNWAALVNDDLGIFKELSKRLAMQGNRGVSQFITSFFFSSAGLNAAIFKAAYKNLITPTYGALATNPPISSQGLMDALKVLAGQLDSSGNPIMITGKLYLVHGPSQIAAANNALKAVNMFVTNEGGTQTASNSFIQQMLQVPNWVAQNIIPIMDPYMPIVMTGAAGNIAQTAWALVCDPDAQERPGVEVGFLNGYETPQIFQKVPNTMRMGGGVDPMLGDYYTMDQEMKIIGVMGGTQIDGRSMVGSTGANA
jgi:hypothetical protein